MRSKLLHESDGQNTYALVFETGDERIGNLGAIARDCRLGGSHFVAPVAALKIGDRDAVIFERSMSELRPVVHITPGPKRQASWPPIGRSP